MKDILKCIGLLMVGLSVAVVVYLNIPPKMNTLTVLN